MTAFDDFTVFIILLIRSSFYYSQLKQHYYFLIWEGKGHQIAQKVFSRVNITDNKYYIDLRGIYETTDFCIPLIQWKHFEQG